MRALREKYYSVRKLLGMFLAMDITHDTVYFNKLTFVGDHFDNICEQAN